MKREQRSRNERWQLAVKIVCGAIASLLAGAFAASELFALSTRFASAWVSLFLPVPSLGDCYLVVKVAHERSGTLHPAFAARRGLSCNPLFGVYNSCPDSLAVLAGVQRHPRQRALGEALGHQTSRLDQPRGSLRR